VDGGERERAPAGEQAGPPVAQALVDEVTEAAERHYREREREMGGETFHRLERWIVLGLEWEGGGFRGIEIGAEAAAERWLSQEERLVLEATASHVAGKPLAPISLNQERR